MSTLGSAGRPFGGESYNDQLSDSIKTFTVGTTPVQIAKQDGDAVYTGIFGDDANVLTIGFNGNVTAGQGITFPLYQPRLEFDVKKHGPLAQRGYWAVASAGTSVVTVVRVRRDLA